MCRERLRLTIVSPLNLGYEDYQFEVPTSNAADSYARYLLRVEEMHQSLRIINQCLKKLEPGPVMVEDGKIAWPAKLAIGADGMGNSLEHVTESYKRYLEGRFRKEFDLVGTPLRIQMKSSHNPFKDKESV